MRDPFDIGIKIILFLWLSALTVWTLFQGMTTTQTQDTTPLTISPPTEVVSEKCGSDCEQKIEKHVAEAIATLSATLTPPPPPPAGRLPPPPPAQPRVSYISIAASGTTIKTDWADLSNTDFTFDISDYINVQESRWSVNLKLQHGNGEAFARLFDVTNKVAVPGSEISTKNSSYTLVESGLVTFLKGKNQYRVQLKSLSGFEVSFGSGTIKIISD